MSNGSSGNGKKIVEMKKGVGGVPVGSVVLTAIVVKEYSYTYTPKDLRDEGGLEAAKQTLMMLADKHGTVVSRNCDVKDA